MSGGDLDHYPEWVAEVACPRCGSLAWDVCYRVDTYDSLLHPHKERRDAGRARLRQFGYASSAEYTRDND